MDKYNILAASSLKNPEKSIMAMRFDSVSNSLQNLWDIPFPKNCSFFAVYKNYIYAVNENEKSAEIQCLKLLHDLPPVKICSFNIPNASGLCHLSVSDKNKLLYASCYLSGHAAVFDISTPESPKLLFVHNTSADTSKAFPTARTHCMLEDTGGNFAFSVNIELDRIYSYIIENASVRLNEKQPYIQLPHGEGPRHLMFHPKLPVAYCVTEYSNRLICFDYSPSVGELKIKSAYSTLQDGFCGESFGASIAIDNSCNFLYISNRGENSIAVFSINSNGVPSKVQSFLTNGNWPRHIAFTDDCKYLAVCQQKSSYIELLELEKSLIKKSVLKIPAENVCFACSALKK